MNGNVLLHHAWHKPDYYFLIQTSLTYETLTVLQPFKFETKTDGKCIKIHKVKGKIQGKSSQNKEMFYIK